MSLTSATYFYLTCNGRLNNIAFPRCPAVSDGALGDEETVRSEAAAIGWIVGAKNYCPGCAHKHTPAEGDTPPAKRTRRPKAAAEPEQPQHEEHFA